MSVFNPQSIVPISQYNPFPGILLPFFFGWGESTSKGFLANPADTPQGSVPGSWVAGGPGCAIRPLDGSTNMATNFASLQQMFSQTINQGGQNFGETPDCGAMVAFGQALLRLNGIDIGITGAVPGQQFVAANGAIETQTQNALNTMPDYQLVIDILTGFTGYASGAVLTTAMPSMLSAIGHNDMVAGTNPALFAGQMQTGRAQVNSTWNGLTGQTGNAPMFYCTVGSWVAAGVPVTGIPMQMVVLAQTDPLMFNAGPTYVCFYAAGTGVHYQNVGARVYGYNIGWAKYWWHVRNVKWTSPFPATLTRDGSSVHVRFGDIFIKPLRFKTDFVTDMGNYGFLLLHNDQATATSCSIAAGVLTVGGSVTGSFGIGKTIWASNYTGLGNVSYGNTIVSAAGANMWNLSIADTVNAGAFITAQTVENINTPTITADDTVTLTSTAGTTIPADWVVGLASRGTRNAGPTTGPRTPLCDSTEFPILSPQVPLYTIRGYAHPFEIPLT